MQSFFPSLLFLFYFPLPLSSIPSLFHFSVDKIFVPSSVLLSLNFLECWKGYILSFLLFLLLFFIQLKKIFFLCLLFSSLCGALMFLSSVSFPFYFCLTRHRKLCIPNFHKQVQLQEEANKAIRYERSLSKISTNHKEGTAKILTKLLTSYPLLL